MFSKSGGWSLSTAPGPASPPPPGSPNPGLESVLCGDSVEPLSDGFRLELDVDLEGEGTWNSLDLLPQQKSSKNVSWGKKSYIKLEVLYNKKWFEIVHTS